MIPVRGPADQAARVGEGSILTPDGLVRHPEAGESSPLTLSLEPCWAKIDRARDHRDALDRRVRDTFSIDTNRPRIGVRFDAARRQHVLYVSRLPDLDPFLNRAGLYLGDVMHNFRSALDHLAYQLAAWHTGGRVGRPKRVQFPIADNSAHFASARGDALREIHPDHQVMIERFQPYHRIPEGAAIGPEFHSLAVLRDLDNADKQRRLRLTLIAPTAAGAYRGDAVPVVRAGLDQAPGWATTITPLVEGAELIRATLPQGVTVAEADIIGDITPGVGLPEGWPIDHIMDRVGAFIIKVIGAFQLR